MSFSIWVNFSLNVLIKKAKKSVLRLTYGNFKLGWGRLDRESGWKVTCGPAGKTISCEQAVEIVHFKLSNEKFGNQTFDCVGLANFLVSSISLDCFLLLD